jgi:Flp pilus assembly protein TadG
MRRTASRARQGRRSGQAALEMAIVLPILFALVCNFLAIMVMVQESSEVQAATGLAAQASVRSPVGQPPVHCDDAAVAFFDTTFSTTGAGYAGCGGAGPTFSATAPDARPLYNVSLSCNGGQGSTNYFTGNGYTSGTAALRPVTCTGKADYDFGATPLGAFVVWQPRFTFSAQALPPAARQCAAASC